MLLNWTYEDGRKSSSFLFFITADRPVEANFTGI